MSTSPILPSPPPPDQQVTPQASLPTEAELQANQQVTQPAEPEQQVTPQANQQADFATLSSPARDALEAAAFRRLVMHLQGRTDVQNLALMDLSGFCRNCLSRWLVESAAASGVSLSQDSARTYVYGMPYARWKSDHQR